MTSNKNKMKWFFLIFVLTGYVVLQNFAGTTTRPVVARPVAPSVSSNYGRLPLSFEIIQGQTDRGVKFLSRGSGYNLFLTPTEAVLVLHKASARNARLSAEPEGTTSLQGVEQTPSTVLRMQLVEANASAQISGLGELPGKSNYFIGNDPNKWRTNVSNYTKVEYRDVYPGVNLLYYGNQRQLEHDFVVAPGADYKAITLAFEGTRGISLNSDGDLVMDTDEGEVQLKHPRVYQKLNSEEQEVAARYVLKGEGCVGFEVAEYDHRQSLVIDPVLSYSTYLGGSGSDTAYGIAVDSSGNAYVTGNTYSTDFPTSNPLHAAFNGGTTDAFVSKLNADSSALLYSTYLGGSGVETGQGIAVDSSGNAYVTGFTNSTNFPTANPIQATYGGGHLDAFVVKINPTGSALVYSTYLGGSGAGDDYGYGIAVDSSGNAYITGYTQSTDFPTANAIYSNYSGSTDGDAFVSKINAAGSALVYSTYLGGSGRGTQGRGIAVDSSGNAYVTGHTSATNFPTANALYATFSGGNYDAFVTKLNAAGSALVYSTYLGGSAIVARGGDGGTAGNSIAVDSSGDAYVSGITGVSNFPTANALYPTYGGGASDGFVAKLNAAGSALVYSTYLGGSGEASCDGIAVDSSGNAYVAGFTRSTDFPTANALYATSGGGYSDAFVTKFNATGSALLFSTYLGGSSVDVGYSIALDSSGNIYITGLTDSSNFPTANALYPAYNGSDDAFVAKISVSTPLANPAVTFTGAPPTAVYQSSFNVTSTTNASTTAVFTATGACSVFGNTVTMTSGTGTCNLTATWAADSNFQAASASQSTTAVKAASVLTWSAPNAITLGTALSGTQLDATANVAGNFIYTPPAGTVLPVGTSTLSVSFMPNDTADYTTATAHVSIAVEYGVCLLYDPTRSVHSGAAYPIKINLCSASGANVSSSAIVLHATGITGISGYSGPPQDAGNSNPDFDFRFAGGGYIFNLKTTGLSAGTYSLQFTASNDPVVHSVPFGVK
jgi:hypothetical protein